MIRGGQATVGGLALIITLLVGDAASSDNLWSVWWFVSLFVASAIVMVVGLYLVASAYIPLWLPKTRDERGAVSPAAQKGESHAGIAALRAWGSEDSTVSINVFPPHQIPTGRHLASLFELAGWRTSFNETPQESVARRYVEGITVAGFNDALLRAVVEALAEAGLPDLRPELRTTNVAPSNPKYRSVAQTIDITIGHVTALEA